METVLNKEDEFCDDSELMKRKKKEKHEKKFNSNGMASHRSVLCCRNNIQCNRNVLGNFAIFNLNV